MSEAKSNLGPHDDDHQRELETDLDKAAADAMIERLEDEPDFNSYVFARAIKETQIPADALSASELARVHIDAYYRLRKKNAADDQRWLLADKHPLYILELEGDGDFGAMCMERAFGKAGLAAMAWGAGGKVEISDEDGDGDTFEGGRVTLHSFDVHGDDVDELLGLFFNSMDYDQSKAHNFIPLPGDLIAGFNTSKQKKIDRTQTRLTLAPVHSDDDPPLAKKHKS
ncbi:MAG: hypothetical protein M0R22_04300 [Dehalococcoidia bacterium]|jgi:hypothetical protein|nr:hypothetical protein [Dehalococcoidia bacterium]